MSDHSNFRDSIFPQSKCCQFLMNVCWRLLISSLSEKSKKHSSLLVYVKRKFTQTMFCLFYFILENQQLKNAFQVLKVFLISKLKMKYLLILRNSVTKYYEILSDDVNHKTIPYQFRIMKKKGYLFKGKNYWSLF